jgi:ubiquitin C-terminal hydrolase
MKTIAPQAKSVPPFLLVAEGFQINLLDVLIKRQAYTCYLDIIIRNLTSCVCVPPFLLCRRWVPAINLLDALIKKRKLILKTWILSYAIFQEHAQSLR